MGKVLIGGSGGVRGCREWGGRKVVARDWGGNGNRKMFHGILMSGRLGNGKSWQWRRQRSWWGSFMFDDGQLRFDPPIISLIWIDTSATRAICMGAPDASICPPLPRGRLPPQNAFSGHLPLHLRKNTPTQNLSRILLKTRNHHIQRLIELNLHA